jgi:hypothetical protein
MVRQDALALTNLIKNLIQMPITGDLNEVWTINNAENISLFLIALISGFYIGSYSSKYKVRVSLPISISSYLSEQTN